MKLISGAHSIPSPAHLTSDDSLILPISQPNNQIAICGIFDGMGSLIRGGDSAREMTRYLIHFHREIRTKSLQSLEYLLLEANMEIASWDVPFLSKYKRAGGCAGTVVVFLNDTIHTFHAGDTRALLIRSEYRSLKDHILLTTIHNSMDGGLTSFWGLGNGLIVDKGRFSFNEDDILFLATDGILDVVTDDEIASTIRESNYFTRLECQALCRSLCNLAQKRGSLDDITALVVYREE